MACSGKVSACRSASVPTADTAEGRPYRPFVVRGIKATTRWHPGARVEAAGIEIGLIGKRSASITIKAFVA